MEPSRSHPTKYSKAVQACQDYLDEFFYTEQAIDVRFELGNLLSRTGEHGEAFTQYMKVVAMAPEGEHGLESARLAVDASDEMLILEKTGGGLSGRSDSATGAFDALDLTKWEKNSIAACDQYAKFFPDDPWAKTASYQAAYLLYNKYHFENAVDRFLVAIPMEPRSAEAEQAANLGLDSLTLIEDWRNLVRFSEAIYQQEGLGSSRFKQEVFDINERSSFKLIEVNMEEGRDKLAAANAYRAFYDSFPESGVADLALNNAAVYFYDEGRHAKAIETRLLLVERFPQSKYYLDQVASLGWDYESVEDYANAAHWYEVLFQAAPGHRNAPEALASVGLFRLELGEWRTANSKLEQFVAAYPDHELVSMVNEKLREIREQHPDSD